MTDERVAPAFISFALGHDLAVDRPTFDQTSDTCW